jgi:serpin B
MLQAPRSVLVLLVGVLLSGCAAPGSPAGTGEPSVARGATESPSTSGSNASFEAPALAMSDVERLAVDPDQAILAAEAINALGLDLLRTATDGQSNAILSPTSIVLALAMVRAGARGATAAEMDAVMRDVGADENAAWLASLDALLAGRSGTFRGADQVEHELAFRSVNAPFAQEGFRLEQAYLDALAARFGAGLRLVDYVGATESARRGINGWVDEQTEHRIPEFLEPGIVDETTRLVLVNAIYLKAAWLTQFDEQATRPRPFHRLDGSTIDVPTMYLSHRTPFTEGEGWFAVDLPFVGHQLSMLVIVPDDLAAFEGGLDPAGLAAIVDRLEPRHMVLGLPRFGIETKVGLKPALSDLGMPSAFDPEVADFSGITTADRLYFSAVIHQANIDVDETGAEAAAATGAVANVVSAPLPVTVDRPFLFALRDRQTGAVMFLGRVVEPVER